MGLRQTGGRLTTIEFDPVRAKEAAANVQRAGLSDIVRVVHGDAFKEIPEGDQARSIWCSSMRGSLTTRSSSRSCFRASTPGGLFLAHNVINKKNDMLDFLAAIERHPHGAHHHGVAGPRRDFDHLQEAIVRISSS